MTTFTVSPGLTPYLFYVSLHLEGRVKLAVAVLTLREVAEVNVLLLTGVYVTLDVHHGLDVVVQHLITVPALENKGQKELIKVLKYCIMALMLLYSILLQYQHWKQRREMG